MRCGRRRGYHPRMVRTTLALLLTCGLAGAQDRPNILWLTTEDNAAHWYRLYDPEHGVAMPTVERLAAEGLVFERAYSCAPVCSVARSTLISGCYAPRLGAQFHRRVSPVAMPEGLHMFPWYLRQAGYHTTNNSKEDYNFRPADKGGVWDASSSKATYADREPGQPFFHVQNFTRTHEGKLFGGLPKGRELLVDPDTVEVLPYHPDTPLFREKVAQYLTLNRIVDEEMGGFLARLEAEDLLKDTFVFHFGDHGGVLPGSKGYAREDGLHVPLVVHVPERWAHLAPAPRGSRLDGIVEFVDLAPTVLRLAGVEPPPSLDGSAFLGAGVTREQLAGRDTAYGFAERFDEKVDLVRFLRKGRFSYWRSYQPFNFDGLHNNYRYRQPAFREWRDLARAGELDERRGAFFAPRRPEQLFDLHADPHETRDLAADPRYAAVLEDLRRELQHRVRTLPDTGMIPEPVLLSEAGAEVAAWASAQRPRIAHLLAIADLQLQPYAVAAPGLTASLEAQDPLERYWALVVCSTFGSGASPLAPRIRDLAQGDPDRLVRMRAAEYLTLTGLGQGVDPAAVLHGVLAGCEDPIEANLVLNTVVLLRDAHGLAFEVPADAPWTRLGGQVPRRVEYLSR